MTDQFRRPRRGSFSLPDSVNGWLLDKRKTNIENSCEHPQFTYRKKIGGERYEVFVEDEGDGKLRGILHKSSECGHSEPIYSFSGAEGVEGAYNICQKWMRDELFVKE